LHIACHHAVDNAKTGKDGGDTRCSARRSGAGRGVMAQGPLDTLIHLALSRRQEKFAKHVGSALRFIPEIGPLSGFADKNETLASLKDAMVDGEVMGFFFDKRPDLPEGFTATVAGPLVQLVHDGKTAPLEEEASQDIVALGEKD